MIVNYCNFYICTFMRVTSGRLGHRYKPDLFPMDYPAAYLKRNIIFKMSSEIGYWLLGEPLKLRFSGSIIISIRIYAYLC